LDLHRQGDLSMRAGRTRAGDVRSIRRSASFWVVAVAGAALLPVVLDLGSSAEVPQFAPSGRSRGVRGLWPPVGRVVTESGSYVPGATVRLAAWAHPRCSEAEGSEFLVMTESGAAGEFAFDGSGEVRRLLQRDALTLWAEAGAQVSEHVFLGRTSAGGRGEYTLVLTEATPVEVIVWSREGSPIAEASVHVTVVDRALGGHQVDPGVLSLSGKTGSNGVAVLPRIPTRLYTDCEVVARVGRGPEQLFLQVPVRRSPTAFSVFITAETCRSVHGAVEHYDGRPAAGYRVEAKLKEGPDALDGDLVSTDKWGRFEIVGGLCGDTDLVVMSGLPARLGSRFGARLPLLIAPLSQLDRSGHEVLLRLPRTHPLRIRVNEDRDADVRGWVGLTRADRRHGGLLVQIDEDGWASFPEVSSSSDHLVSLHGRSPDGKVIGEFRVPAGASEFDVRSPATTGR